MDIYFIRHGKDEEGYRGGWSQRGLTEEGRKQAQKLANHLYANKDIFKFTRLISSDLNRAKETAYYIAEKFEIEIELNQEWRETNNGIIAGLPNEEVEKTFPGLYFASLGMDESYSGGESPREFFDRISHSFYKLIEEVNQRKEDIVVITHSGVINIIYHLVKGIEWNNKRSKITNCYNTSVHKIAIDGKNMKVALNNYIDHLSYTLRRIDHE
ncbi:histidine phosphatase family protein [Mobilitalea sibirica]|uniref:Histidine phosphatase family protein n=1 Tax=Mobilitalea sibirica TaxID=1462919 RepID=A0A8J7H5G4_9FIRM|nr:histidine phosphatase family protein [Mobilitalea sibirica]MBH1942572.1 histidine phosphatase family protein [Mobilitalea sibirica]